MNSLQNPWHVIDPSDPPYVLASDELHIRAFNTTVGEGSRDALNLTLLPDPWVGRLEAPVALLNLNPGHSPGDAAHQLPEVRRAIVANRAVVGRGCRVFGDLAHTQADPLLGWDDDESEEASPVLEDQAFVGWRAKAIGPVTLGTRSYICAAPSSRGRCPAATSPTGSTRSSRTTAGPGRCDSPFLRS